MWVSDHTGTLIRMNQAGRDLLDITDKEFVGKYNVFEDNIAVEQGVMPLVKRVFEDGESVRFHRQLRHFAASNRKGSESGDRLFWK